VYSTGSLEPRHLWHHDIQDHHIRFQSRNHHDSFGSVWRVSHHDQMRMLVQNLPNHSKNERLVICENNAKRNCNFAR
jgi:hypothetical protein